MNDCPDADVRDLLPDLLDERLDSTARAGVEAHLATCGDCRAELELLRGLRGAMRSQAPALDLAGIVAALPAPRRATHRSWVGWRTAAAITIVAAGGSSLVMLRSNVEPVTDTLAIPQVSPAITTTPRPVVTRPSVAPVVPAQAEPSAPVSPVSPPVTAAPNHVPAQRELAMSGGTMTDLSDKELAALLKDIDKMDAMPSVDLETPSISPIAPRRP